MATRKTPAAAWKPGQSGNPRGRPPGAGQLAQLRASIAGDVPGIIKALTDAALGGDTQAARLLLERCLPPIKPIEQATPLTLPTSASLSDQGRAVLAAVAAGEMAPSQGAALIGALGTMAKIHEVDELERRIAALEGNHGNGA